MLHMKNLYHSTRNKQNEAHDYEAVLQGIAADGGLYVWDGLGEHAIDIEAMLSDSYAEMAEKIMRQLLPDFSDEELHRCIRQAYGESFDTQEITPLKKVGNDYFLELFHGPTSAFKDVGLQMLPQLMSCALAKEAGCKVMILTATSGDTGKAALEGFRDVAHTGIIVFYPDQGVSATQQLQMATQEGSNVAVCALKGNFDDAQSQVKAMFADKDLSDGFACDNITFSSANSINIGRLIPQVVYYFYAYIQMIRNREIRPGDAVNFCVPTGNFGNVLAGYYAKLMGLPVRRFIVASNANNVLCDFLTTGVYDRNRPFRKTISPSMDILISSNLERLLYYMGEKDTQKIRGYMEELQQTGSYAVDDSLKQNIQELFYGGCSSDEETRSAIRDVYHAYGYVMDPHTAVGYNVMKEYQKQDPTPCILLSTASPYKFSKEVYRSIFEEELTEEEFAIMEKLAMRTSTEIPRNLFALKNKQKRFYDCIKKEDMPRYITQKTKEIFYD